MSERSQALTIKDKQNYKTSPNDTHDYKRKLKNRHLQMLVLGGVIGTGLFYGSAEAISTAGPGVIIAYAIGGIAIFFIMRALAEMTVQEPVSGAFSHYPSKHWNARAGFISGWNYWFIGVAVSMVELAVVGTFVNYWAPNIPMWVSAAFFLVTITALNLLGVRIYGEFEFWLSLIKVAAVVAMIVFGLAIISFGISTNPDLPSPSFGNLVQEGGLLPFGLSGLVTALVVVTFSFSGSESFALTAGEVEEPEKTIPKAVNRLVLRILLFFIGSITVILAIIPWTQIDGQMSPFVQIFDSIGIVGAAHILNFVVLTAAVSVYNSILYGTGRVLQNLAKMGNAPAWLGRVSRNGVPIRAILATALVTVGAVIVVFLWPDFAFRYLMSIATIAALINWSIILITHLKFRRTAKLNNTPIPRYTLRWSPFSNWIILAYLGLILALMIFTPAYQTAALIGPVWIIILFTAYEIKRRKRMTTHP